MKIQVETVITKHDLHLWKVKYRATSGMRIDLVEIANGEVINKDRKVAVTAAYAAIGLAVEKRAAYLMGDGEWP